MAGIDRDEARRKARQMRVMAGKLETAVGIKSDAERKRQSRQQDRIVIIPPLSPADRKERERREADDELWIRSYWSAFSNNEFYELSDQQRQMVADFHGVMDHGGDRAVAASRGEGKTTLSVALTVKGILCGVIDFAIILAANSSNSGEILETINLALSEDPELLRYYPEVCVPIVALENTAQRAGKQLVNGERHDNGEPFEMAPSRFHWAGNKLIFPRVPGSPSSGAIVISQGLDSALRGCKIRNHRPRIVLIDDPDIDDTINNPVQADKLLTKIDRGIAALGSQQCPVTRLVLCTIASTTSAAAKLTDTKTYPSFRGRRFRFLIKPPANAGLWDKFVALCKAGWANRAADDSEPPIPLAAHQMYLEHREEMDEGSEVSNPNRFDHRIRPEGGTVEVSSLEHYYGWVARIGADNTRTEFDNDPPEVNAFMQSRLTWLSVAESAGEFLQRQVDPTTTAIVRGVDVRKIELHDVTLATDSLVRYRVADYGVRSHGTSETTVEQAETLILEALYRLADQWATQPLKDEHGIEHTADITLIDKGWIGNWTEDGETKTWVSQPVETFCMEAGLDRFLPAKGAPKYSPPAPAPGIIIGDNWHINRGRGKLRICSEVIWNANHWHRLVEELFLLSEDNQERAELFAADGGIWTNHKGFAQHIESGSRELHEQMARGTRSRKPRFARDHWWDAMAMALVAMSIIGHRVKRRERQKPRMTLSQMAGR